MKKNTEAFLVAIKDNGTEVNAFKTTYVFMYRDQNSRRSHNIRYYTISFERVKEFKLLGMVLKYENSIQQDIKSRLMSGKVFYHPSRIFVFQLSFAILYK